MSVIENHIFGERKHLLSAEKRPKWREFKSLIMEWSFCALCLLCLRLSFCLLSPHYSSPLQSRSMIVITLTASQHSLAPCRYLVCAMTEAVRLLS